jgi:hypothetical protein
MALRFSGMLLGAVLSTFGCAELQMVTMDRPPGSLQANAKAHGLQTASFAYAFMNGHHFGWPAQLQAMRTDGIAMLEALKAAGYGMEMQVVPRMESNTEVYDVNLTFPKRGPDSGKVTKPAPKGQKGKVAAAPSAAPAPPAAPPPAALPSGRVPPIAPAGVDQAVVIKGFIGISSIANFMTQLNVSNETLQGHAFALLVLREKIKAGEKADWFGANRPAQESLDDIDFALRLVAMHHADIQVFRSHVLAILALSAAADAPGALDELRKQLDEDEAWSAAWTASHKLPTMEDFGVAVQAIPTADSFLKKMDGDMGFLTAAIQTAQGIATGSPQMTLDGLSKLAPKDSTVGIALTGLSAAGHGDIAAVLDSVGKLTGTEADVKDIQERLSRVQGGLQTVRNTANGLPI